MIELAAINVRNAIRFGDLRASLALLRATGTLGEVDSDKLSAEPRLPTSAPDQQTPSPTLIPPPKIPPATHNQLRPRATVSAACSAKNGIQLTTSKRTTTPRNAQQSFRSAAPHAVSLRPLNPARLCSRVSFPTGSRAISLSEGKSGAGCFQRARQRAFRRHRGR